VAEPLVTVGLPVYNGERFVSKSLDTLLAQTFEDFKIVISDNASTDRTGEICREYASRDRRIEYHRNPTNIGLAGNLNLTSSMCRSKYFRWATADDFCAPELLAEHVPVLESDPEIALCYSQAWLVDEHDVPYESWKDKLHLMQDDPVERFELVVKNILRVHHHLGLMRTEFLQQTRGLASHISSDQGLIAELSLLGKFFQLEKPLFFRRMHRGSSSWETFNENHQARYYHPANVKRIPFGRLRFHAYYVSVVRRSALSATQRLELYAFLARYSAAEWRWLGGELRYELLRLLKANSAA
jgi:glycosyltransferase involved in cell wall biosynthesis